MSKSITLIILSLGPGGAERFVSELANLFAEKEYETNIILLSNSTLFYALNDKIRIFKPSQLKMGIKKVSRIKYGLKLIFYIRDTIKLIGKTTIFNFAFPSFVLLALTRIKQNKFVFFRCNPSRTYMIERYNIPLFIRKILYRNINGIILQTNAARKAVFNQFPNTPLYTIPNILNADFITRNDSQNKKNIIFTVGRLIKSKRIDHAIQAFSMQKNKEYELHIIGEGPAKKDLEKVIDSLDVREKVVFRGNVKNVADVLKDGKIFIFTSEHEGFPNALLEAMASPLACISYDCDYGPSDLIINEQNGILVESGNVESLTKELHRLINDQEKIMYLMNRSIKVREKYNKKFVGEKLEQLL